MSDQITFFDHPRIGLRSLLRLRWAIAGLELIVCLALPHLIQIQLPTTLLLVAISITILSNIWLSLPAKQGKLYGEATCLALITFDTVNLCFMLFISGGAHNPFSSLFLINIVMGAILLSRWKSWIVTLINCCAFASLFWSPNMEHSHGDSPVMCGVDHSIDGYQLHLQGMLASLVLTGSCLAFFVGQLRHELLLREQMLERHRGDSNRNERFAALATLTAGMAHELSTPLGTIAIISKELEHKTAELCQDNDCVEDAKLIRSEVERCRSILSKAGQQMAAYREADSQIVSGEEFPALLSQHLNPQQLKQLEIRIKSAPLEFKVPAEPLLQSLAILIQNACDASDANQLISLSLSQTEHTNLFAVSDEGSGISKSHLPRLGEPFFTTKAPGEGMGLGLFIVRSFVDRIGGELQITSEEAKGATFTIHLPRQPLA